MDPVLALSFSKNPSVEYMEGNIRLSILKIGLITRLKHRGDKSLDLSSFPIWNPKFQHSTFNTSGFPKFKFVNIYKVHLPLHIFLHIICFIICCQICIITFYCCIEVNVKHRVCPSGVMAQNTKYIGLYGISQLRYGVTPTLRIPKTIIWFLDIVIIAMIFSEMQRNSFLFRKYCSRWTSKSMKLNHRFCQI